VTEHNLSEQQSRLIANRIREELARRRMSRRGLADLAKISISTLEKVLSGRRPFTLATTIRIEGALGVNLRTEAAPPPVASPRVSSATIQGHRSPGSKAST
jgi:transcriptional regulator with XRE-family HTH domain